MASLPQAIFFVGGGLRSTWLGEPCSAGCFEALHVESPLQQGCKSSADPRIALDEKDTDPAGLVVEYAFRIDDAGRRLGNALAHGHVPCSCF